MLAALFILFVGSYLAYSYLLLLCRDKDDLDSTEKQSDSLGKELWIAVSKNRQITFLEAVLHVHSSPPSTSLSIVWHYTQVVVLGAQYILATF